MTPQSICNLKLTPTQVADFKREGYLIYDPPVFEPKKFTALKDHFDKKLARLAADCRPEAMDVPHFTDLKLFDWLFDDEVLDLVEPIIGPDIALFSSHFICKPKGDGKRVPWHEDSFYWRGMLDPMEVVTVWLAIDPSLEENGCMKVLPRTHDNGYSEYDPVDAATHVFSIEIKKHLRDDSKAVSIILQPNHASLHDGKLMHSSNYNHSDLRRCGYTMRYMSTRVRLSVEFQQRHQVYLARGKDHAGNPYADPAKSYGELARFRETVKRGGH